MCTPVSAVGIVGVQIWRTVCHRLCHAMRTVSMASRCRSDGRTGVEGTQIPHIRDDSPLAIQAVVPYVGVEA